MKGRDVFKNNQVASCLEFFPSTTSSYIKILSISARPSANIPTKTSEAEFVKKGQLTAWMRKILSHLGYRRSTGNQFPNETSATMHV